MDKCFIDSLYDFENANGFSLVSIVATSFACLRLEVHLTNRPKEHNLYFLLMKLRIFKMTQNILLLQKRYYFT